MKKIKKFYLKQLGFLGIIYATFILLGLFYKTLAIVKSSDNIGMYIAILSLVIGVAHLSYVRYYQNKSTRFFEELSHHQFNEIDDAISKKQYLSEDFLRFTILLPHQFIIIQPGTAFGKHHPVHLVDYKKIIWFYVLKTTYRRKGIRTGSKSELVFYCFDESNKINKIFVECNDMDSDSHLNLLIDKVTKVNPNVHVGFTDELEIKQKVNCIEMINHVKQGLGKSQV